MSPPKAADAIDAGVARIVGDVGLAEDLAQDALVAALEQWRGRFEEVRAEFARAASLTQNVRERQLLQNKGDAL